MKSFRPTAAFFTCGLILTAYAALADAQTLNDGNTITLDFSCLGICNGNCAAADGACRLFSDSDTGCDNALSICTSNCQTTCACIDECMGGCQSEAVACQADDSIESFIRGVTCFTRAAFCRGNCPLSCGVQAASANAPSRR